MKDRYTRTTEQHYVNRKDWWRRVSTLTACVRVLEDVELSSALSVAVDRSHPPVELLGRYGQCPGHDHRE